MFRWGQAVVLFKVLKDLVQRGELHHYEGHLDHLLAGYIGARFFDLPFLICSEHHASIIKRMSRSQGESIVNLAPRELKSHHNCSLGKVVYSRACALFSRLL
jgi:hypothetical protein